MRPHQVRLRSECLRHLQLAVLVAESEVVLARLRRNHSQSRRLLAAPAALGVPVLEQADQGVAVV